MKYSSIITAIAITASVGSAQTIDVTSTGVGIGTATHTHLLELANLPANFAQDAVRVNTGTTINVVGFRMTCGSSGTSDIVRIANTDGSVYAGWFNLYADGTSKVQINASPGYPTYFNSGGNVGIGTATPSTKLDVNGAIFASSIGLGALNGIGEKLTVLGDYGYTSTIFQVGQDGNNAIEFRRAGGVQVGSINLTSSSTSYNTSSDGRLKTNIRDLTGSGAIIDALRPRLFDWKTGDKNTYGFVAQEVYPIFPQAVTKGDDDPDVITHQWGIDQAKMVPVLTAEVKSLRARVATLEAAPDATIGRLTARLDRIERENAALNQKVIDLESRGPRPFTHEN